MPTSIQVYGTDWCGLTFAVREYLTNSRVAYDYHNVEQDALADEFVITINDGRRRYPLIVTEEHIVTNPTLTELQELLTMMGYRGRPPLSRWKS
jgi:glutaredoxin